MNNEEKIVFYATARRAYAGKISQIIGGRFVEYFVGKLRGKIVSLPSGQYKFCEKHDAIECAKKFRNSCIDEANRLGVAL